MSASVLIETVETEGFGWGGVVAASFGDVQVAGVFEGRDDGRADGCQVGGSAAGAAGGGIFPERKVTDVVMSLNRPLLADQAGQVAGGGLGAGQAGDGVDSLAGDLAGGDLLPPPGDLEGLAGMGEVQAADVGGFEGAGLGAAVALLAGCAAGRDLRPGQGPDLGVQQRLVAFHDGDVLRVLLADQPVQVRPHRMESIEGHHGTGQIHRSQELGEVAGLVVLDVDLDVIQQVPAMLGDAEQMDPGAVAAAGPRQVLPSTATALNRSRASAFARCRARCRAR